MFGIGMPELFIILVIALVVLGPDKLPTLARAIGRGIGEFRKAADDLKGSLDSDDELKQLKESLTTAKSEMTSIMREQTKDMDVDGVASALADGKFFNENEVEQSDDEKQDEAGGEEDVLAEVAAKYGRPTESPGGDEQKEGQTDSAPPQAGDGQSSITEEKEE